MGLRFKEALEGLIKLLRVFLRPSRGLIRPLKALQGTSRSQDLIAPLRAFKMPLWAP